MNIQTHTIPDQYRTEKSLGVGLVFSIYKFSLVFLVIFSTFIVVQRHPQRVHFENNLKKDTNQMLYKYEET